MEGVEHIEMWLSLIIHLFFVLVNLRSISWNCIIIWNLDHKDNKLFISFVSLNYINYWNFTFLNHILMKNLDTGIVGYSNHFFNF